MNRPLSELEARAMYVLQLPDELRKKFVEVARTKSPSAAFDLAMQLATLHGVNQLAAAKATRWLAVVRRDHGDKVFDQITAKQ